MRKILKKIEIGILDNNIFLLRINNKWYRFKKANIEDNNSLFFEVLLRSFYFKKQYEKMLKMENKKG
jgi:hypothetical protein